MTLSSPGRVMIPRLPLFLICVSRTKSQSRSTLVRESKRQTKYDKSIRSRPLNELIFFFHTYTKAGIVTDDSIRVSKPQQSAWWSQRSDNIRPSLNCPRSLSSSLLGASAICALIPQWGPFSRQVPWQAAGGGGGGSRKVDMNGRQPSPLPLDWLGPAPCV